MKETFFRNVRIYGVFIVCFIILSAALVFYLSCQSKSPTDTAVPATESLAARSTKGTTQTTTSSSTTTTIKPVNSASISTTIITSRNLTTTSTSTTTTSTPEVTTSVIHPPNVKFCYIIGVYKCYSYGASARSAKGVKVPASVKIYNGDTVEVPIYCCLALNFYVHNLGGAPAENVKIIPQNLFKANSINREVAFPVVPIVLPVIAVLPNDGVCVKHPLSSSPFFNCGGGLLLNTVTSKNSNLCIKYKFKLDWKDARWHDEFSFTKCYEFPEE
jgi:hypothetical protein